MEYARVLWLEAPPGALSAGIDWASADHAVCVVDAFGEVVSGSAWRTPLKGCGP
jgi:hypothetical protein